MQLIHLLVLLYFSGESFISLINEIFPINIFINGIYGIRNASITREIVDAIDHNSQFVWGRIELFLVILEAGILLLLGPEDFSKRMESIP